jgi:hypothetical protein
MGYEMKVSFKGDYVEAYSAGDKSYQTAEKLWKEITALCNEHNCYKVLGIADSTRQMSVMDSIDHQKLFQAFNVTPKYKIAWVELNPAESDKLKHLEIILVNRGYQGKAFDNVDAARSWLLKD